MAATQPGDISVQVARARPDDVGKGVARVPHKILEAIGARHGDPIEITGERATAAIAVPPYPDDEGIPIVRLDGLQRANAGVGSGDTVELRRAEPKPARRVVLAPAQKNLRLQGSGDALARTFNRRPLVAGDVVSTSVYHRTPDMERDGGFPEDPFRRLFEAQAYGLAEIRLSVVSTQPKGIVEITSDTEVELLPQYVEPKEARPAEVTYEDVGGIGPVLDQVREMVELPLKHPELFQRLGIQPPKGVIMHGPPGTGKTLIARAVAAEAEAQFFLINGPEIMGKFQGESEQRLRDVFQQAQSEAPAIVFIDELDSIAPKRSSVSNEAERRVVAQLLTLMDGLEPRQNVVVIGATNRVEAIDEALRRPGRFDREVVVGVPDQAGRREVLAIHSRGMPLAGDVNLDELARHTYGYVGADLAALCREAAMETLRRLLPEMNLQDGIKPEALDKLIVEDRDFINAMKRLQPSALREIMIQVPDVRWEDIGGLGEARTQLREGVELPLKTPEAFARMGIRPAKGFLLYGPPGTGKTLLAKAVAREANANFIATKSSDLLSKWYGESEQQVSRLFQRARLVAPTVIFIDEIDSLAPARGGGLGEPAVTERVVNTILSEMDGLEALQGVVVMGATNRPNLLDPALLRPGRFDELIYVTVPDREGRRHILGIHTKDMPLAGDVSLDTLAERTDGFTGADLADLTRRAGLLALRTSLDASQVAAEHFEQALKETRASVTPEMQREYEQLRATLKQEGPTRQPIGFGITQQ
ncbi:CDC48 family AAA ATPase [Caenispirillum salinarum]|uniref:CDC48 family AAA ATPase n=1 Tax=Caenispirillum salinarum TaxID=859058 RepID=UPI00384BA046